MKIYCLFLLVTSTQAKQYINETTTKIWLIESTEIFPEVFCVFKPFETQTIGSSVASDVYKASGPPI